MKTNVLCKNLTDTATMLVLTAAVVALGGCASESNSTMMALTHISKAPREPISVVAFNSADPYARDLHRIESAAGGPFVLPQTTNPGH